MFERYYKIWIQDNCYTLEYKKYHIILKMNGLLLFQHNSLLELIKTEPYFHYKTLERFPNNVFFKLFKKLELVREDQKTNYVLLGLIIICEILKRLDIQNRYGIAPNTEEFFDRIRLDIFAVEAFLNRNDFDHLFAFKNTHLYYCLHNI